MWHIQVRHHLVIATRLFHQSVQPFQAIRRPIDRIDFAESVGQEFPELVVVIDEQHAGPLVSFGALGLLRWFLSSNRLRHGGFRRYDSCGIFHLVIDGFFKPIFPFRGTFSIRQLLLVFALNRIRLYVRGWAYRAGPCVRTIPCP